MQREKETRRLKRPVRKRMTLEDEPPQLYDINKVKSTLMNERQKRQRIKQE